MNIVLGLSATATGTDTITASLSTSPTSLTDGLKVFLTCEGANKTTTPTLNLNSLGAKPIYKNGNILQVGDLLGTVILQYNSTKLIWELITPKNVTTPTQYLTPDSISGLQLWLDASQAMYTASYASQISALNDPIGIIPDRSGNGRLATASATKPKYNPTGMNGYPTIDFSAGGLFNTASFLDSSYNTGFTMMVVLKAVSGAADQYVLGSTSNSIYMEIQDSTKITNFVFANLTPAYTSIGVNPYVNKEGVAALVYKATSGTYKYDRLFNDAGQSGNSSAYNNVKALTGTLGLTGILTIGDIVGGSGNHFNGMISEVILWNTILTQSQYDAMYDYLAKKWGFYTKKMVVCAGNSLTAGTGSSTGATQICAPTGTNYPSQLWNSLGSTNYDVRTDAYSSRVLTQMISETPIFGDMYYLPKSSSKNIFVVWEIINQMAASKSAAATYDLLVKYCLARKAVGWKVVVLTGVAFNYGYSGANNDLLLINTWIRANYLTFADALSDVNAATELSNPANTTYFNVDQIHLTDAGYAVVASLTKTAILTL